MKKQHIVTVSLRCPGLSDRLIAGIISNIDEDKVDSTIAEAKRIGRYIDTPIQATHIYNELCDAETYAKSINEEAERQLAKWRHDVYGEPLPT
jgi:hypothetical protein